MLREDEEEDEEGLTGSEAASHQESRGGDEEVQKQ